MPTTSVADFASLHPDAVAFLALLDRPGAPSFHTLPIAEQRRASDKMMSIFCGPPPAVALAAHGHMPRAVSAGGPLHYRYYRPQGSAAEAALPALLWLHGGGWTIGSLDGYDTVCRELANQAGCAVLALDYRLAPEAPFPAALDDAWFALDWLATNAAELAIDPARLAVGGDSAGGNLAAATALLARDAGAPALRFQLLVYPATDQAHQAPSHARYGQDLMLTRELMLAFRANYLPDPAAYTDWRASPLRAASHAGLPPALVLTASHDPLVDESRAYAERLRAAGVACDYVEFPGLIHGFFPLTQAFTDAARAVTLAAAALRKELTR